MTLAPSQTGTATPSATPPAAPVGRVRAAARHAPTALLALAGLGVVLALHGFLPGMSGSALTALMTAGDVECLRRLGPNALRQYCDAVGVPAGRPFLSGLPQIHGAWLVSSLPGVDAWRAHQVVNVVTDALAFAATYLLGRRWGAPRWIAVVGAVAYLSSLSVIYLSGFWYTFAGFVLLPVFVLGLLWSLDLVECRRHALAAVPAVVLPPLMLFTDGYAFMAALLLTGALGGAWLVRRPVRPLLALAAAAGWAAGAGLAVVLYELYVPPGAAELSVGIGAFRYLGLDVATLVLPQPNLLWTSLTGTGADLSELWGDGSNVVGNYVGLVAAGLAVWVVVVGARHLPRSSAWEVRALALAGTVALVLALGPALKIADPAVPIDPEWDVPVSLTTAWLPTEWLYTEVPGFDAMRATYRWFLVTRLALVLAAVVAGGLLWHRGRPLLAAVLLSVAVAESFVDAVRVTSGRAEHGRHVAAVRWDVIPDAAGLVEPGERVLVLPASNDFLATAVVPYSGGRSYNVGIDRNNRMARESWPPAVTDAALAFGGPETADHVCAVLAQDADVVLLSRISLFHEALAWPPPPERTSALADVAVNVAADRRFEADTGRWFTAVRPAEGPRGRECGT